MEQIIDRRNLFRILESLKADGFKIIFWEYMDNAVVLYEGTYEAFK